MDENLQVIGETPAPMAGDIAGAEPFPGEEVTAESIAASLPKRLPTDDELSFWQRQKKYFKRYRWLLLFLVPAGLFSLIFSYIPMLGILFAFKGSDFNLSKADVMWNLVYTSWTFQNFLDIFSDQRFYSAIANTLIINVIKLVTCFPLSIIIAVQLSELKSQLFAKIVLIIISIPNFLSWAIVIGIWSGLLNPDTGFLGAITGYIMSKPAWFKPLVIIFQAWKGAGWGCILFYSAIVAIDKTYYESATLEGANRLQKMWYLTLPSILPTIALMLVLNIAGMMGVGFEQVYTMMQINPGVLKEDQIILDTFIYEISIVNRDSVPFATALGVFNGLIGLILMVVGNKITTKTMKRGLW